MLKFPISKQGNKNIFIHSKHKGVVTLLGVLALGAVAAAISVSIILQGLNSSRTSFTMEQSAQAKALANACVEEALEEIRESVPYSGTDTLTIDPGECTYIVTTQAGANRTITASGTVGSTIRKARVTIDKIQPQINLTSWKEVAEF